MTPFEQAERFAQDLASSLRLHATLKEVDALSPEELETPENKTIIELLYTAIMMSHDADPIEA